MALSFEEPPKVLLTELEQVRSAAVELIESLQGLNYVPDSFPVDTLKDISRTLCDLENGTAEGCRIPLEYARFKLPAIRREHITFDESTFDLKNAHPSIDRGSIIDVKLTSLTIAVTTALDAYRYLAQESRNLSRSDTIDQIPKDRFELERVERCSLMTISEVDGAKVKIEKYGRKNSKNIKKLIRTMTDLSIFANILNIESTYRRVSFHWLGILGRGLSRYTEVIRVIGKSIIVAADIVMPYAKVWHSFWSDLDERIIVGVRELGDATKAAADRLELEQKPTVKDSIGSLSIDNHQDWIFNYISKRDNGSGVSVMLLSEEMRHQTGIRAKDFVRKAGAQNFRNMINDIPGLIMYPESSTKIRIIDGNLKVEKIKSANKYLYERILDYYHDLEFGSGVYYHRIYNELILETRAKNALSLLGSVGPSGVRNFIKSNFDITEIEHNIFCINDED